MWLLGLNNIQKFLLLFAIALQSNTPFGIAWSLEWYNFGDALFDYHSSIMSLTIIAFFLFSDKK
tara:strand:+ start:256 stop:447 length:192 start_codon:yes stop_codon:yes gene_type:complete